MSALQTLKRCLTRQFSDTSQEDIDLNTYGVTSNEEFKNILEKHAKPSNVRSIKLNGTEVTSIPQCIGRFKNLGKLDLHGNHIQYFPCSLSEVQKLQMLDLSDNDIKELPSVLFSLQTLTYLNLKNNAIYMIPGGLLKLEKLSVINLQGNMNLSSPSLEVCLMGKDAIFQELNKREQRKDLWENWRPFVLQTNGNFVKSLMEICVSCLIQNKVAYKESQLIPSVMKRLVKDFESKTTLPDLKKCSQCYGYFSNNYNFVNHKCKR